MAKFFFALSKILFASMLIMAVLAPAGAKAENVTSCIEEEGVLTCTVWVNEFEQGPTYDSY